MCVAHTHFTAQIRLLLTGLLAVALLIGQNNAFAHCPDIFLSEVQHDHDSGEGYHAEASEISSHDESGKAAPGHHHDRSQTDKTASVCVGAAFAIIGQSSSDTAVTSIVLRTAVEPHAPTSRSIPPQAEPPRI